MKLNYLLPVLLIATAGYAGETTAEKPLPAKEDKQAAPVEEKDYVQFMDELVANLKKLNSQFETIKDNASATKAAAEIEKTAEILVELKKQLAVRLNKLPPADKTAVSEEWETRQQEHMSTFMAHLLRINSAEIAGEEFEQSMGALERFVAPENETDNTESGKKPDSLSPEEKKLNEAKKATAPANTVRPE